MAAARLGVRADMASAIADAVPLDLLETEMARLTRAMADAERQITTANADLASGEQTLEDALTVTGSCQRHYEVAPDAIKRQINQGFFQKLIIGTDGAVEHAELTESFAQLLAPTGRAATDGAQNAQTRPGACPHPRGDSGRNGEPALGALDARGAHRQA